MGPVGPAGPVEPAGPCEPVGPDGPVGPSGPVGPAGPAGPVGPVAPVSPLSPVRAKVTAISSPSENGVEAEESTALTVMSKYPVSSVREDIVNSTNWLESVKLEILTCPFMVEVESSIVRRKD